MIILTVTLEGPINGAISRAEDAGDVVRRGTLEVGAVTGLWQATTAVGEAPSANRTAVFILPRVGIIVTDSLGANWWRGNVEVVLEPLFARFTQPFAAEAAGGSLVVKYNFLSLGRWMPFWDVGSGMIWTNLAPRIPEQSTQFEFVLETGPGVHIHNGDVMKRKTFANSVLQTRGWIIGSAAVLLLLSAGGLMLLAQHAREQGNVVMVLLALHLASWSYVLGIVGLVLVPVLEFMGWFHAKRAAVSRYSSVELGHRDLEKSEMENPFLHLGRDCVVPSGLLRHSADRNEAKSSIKVA